MLRPIKSLYEKSYKIVDKMSTRIITFYLLQKNIIKDKINSALNRGSKLSKDL